jgi:hypothetical protein
VLLLVLVTAGCGAAQDRAQTETAGAARSLPGLTPEKLEKLREWSIETAAEMGEQRPTGGVVLATTQHHFYEKANGPTGGRDFDAFVVGYKGDFTEYGASRPAGVPAPRGHSVYVIYRADTLEVSDWGVGDLTFDPGKIGQWIPLDLEHCSLLALEGRAGLCPSGAQELWVVAKPKKRRPTGPP